MREDAAVFGDEVQPGGLAGDLVAADQEDDADDQEQHQSRHLHQREPEFHFAEPLDGDHVHRADQDQGDEREHPLRNGIEGAPVMHVQSDGGDIDDAGHRPVEVVHPAGDKGAAFAQKFARVGDEAAGGGAVHDEFAEGAQDEKGEQTADQIHDGERRAGMLQTGRRRPETGRCRWRRRWRSC